VNESDKILSALRDFFLARDAAELKSAYADLACTPPGRDAPTVADWDELEFAFNRLFVGPRAPLAPPFASYYMDGERTLMGPTTLLVREMRRASGLTSPLEHSVPDDHLGLELDAYLCPRQMRPSPHAPELQVVRDCLLMHLGTWLPRFAARVEGTGHVPPAILFAASTAADEAVSLALQVVASLDERDQEVRDLAGTTMRVAVNRETGVT
jgi:putative dimethyl sulfoxide reductase chaperone